MNTTPKDKEYTITLRSFLLANGKYRPFYTIHNHKPYTYITAKYIKVDVDSEKEAHDTALREALSVLPEGIKYHIAKVGTQIPKRKQKKNDLYMDDTTIHSMDTSNNVIETIQEQGYISGTRPWR